MNNHVRAPQALEPGGVDLLALCRVLWKQKHLLCAIVLLFTLAAVAYGHFATPHYQVGSVLRPAPIKALDALNRSGIYNLPAAEALLKVGVALGSYDTQLSFFRDHPELFDRYGLPGQTPEQRFEHFNRASLSLAVPDGQRNDGLNAFVQVDLTYPQGVEGAAIVNGLVDYALAAERQQIAADLGVILGNRLRELQGQLAAVQAAYDSEKAGRIAQLLEADELKRAQLHDELDALRLQLKTERNDRIAQLSEAISIAGALGIKKPATPSSLADAGRAGASTMVRTEVNSQQMPLYFMGGDALEAERAVLKRRTTDDFTDRRVAQIAAELLRLQVNRQVEVLRQRTDHTLFLRDVEPLRAEMNRLRELDIDAQALTLVTVDQVAQLPAAPIKPNKALIAVAGLAAGLFVAVLVALIRHWRVGL